MTNENPIPTTQADFIAHPKIGKAYYNTAFLPKTGDVSGSWWDPSYYMFFFTLVLIIINTIYINVKTSGAHFGPSIIVTLILFVVTYFFTRSSSCLWAGGCQVFAVFNLLFPFIMIIITFLLEDISLRLSSLKDIDYPKEDTKPKPKPNPEPELTVVEVQQASEDTDDDDEEVPADGFTNMIEPYSSYYPY